MDLNEGRDWSAEIAPINRTIAARLEVPRKQTKWRDAIKRTQCCRATRPKKLKFSASERAFDLRLIGSLQPDAQQLKKILETYSNEHGDRPRSALMLVGPEGDFTPAELALARRHGCQPITLGPIILRSRQAIYSSILSTPTLSNATATRHRRFDGGFARKLGAGWPIRRCTD
jgi:16S rRNA (uracil1498-N3)-methyltransferase